MLHHRLDVAVYGPQTMAFVVDASAMERYCAALRRAVGDGEATELHALWREHAPRYFEARSRTRWRVPAPTLRALLDLGERHATDGSAERASITRARDWLGTRDHVDAAPDTWFVLEAARGRLVSDLLVPLWLHILAGELDALRAGIPRLEERPTGPRGDIAWAREIRQATDPRDGSVRALADLPDWSVAAIVDPPATLPAWVDSPRTAEAHAFEQLAGADVLEVLVGPYRRSVGPGPFLPPPRAGVPIDDVHAPRLPLFAERHGEHGVMPIIDGRLLVGDAIDAALDEAHATEPGTGWWTAWDRERHLELGTTASGWRDLASVAADWPRVRDRYVAALRDARRTGHAVVVVPARLDDQGPVAGPPGAPGGAECTAPTTATSSVASRTSVSTCRSSTRSTRSLRPSRRSFVCRTPSRICSRTLIVMSVVFAIPPPQGSATDDRPRRLTAVAPRSLGEERLARGRAGDDFFGRVAHRDRLVPEPQPHLVVEVLARRQARLAAGEDVLAAHAVRPETDHHPEDRTAAVR
jgi:hypothetical protein